MHNLQNCKNKEEYEILCEEQQKKIRGFHFSLAFVSLGFMIPRG